MNNVLGFLESKTDAAGGENGPAAAISGPFVVPTFHSCHLSSSAPFCSSSRRSRIKPISSLCLRPLVRAGARLSKFRSMRSSPPCRCLSASWSPSALPNTMARTYLLRHPGIGRIFNPDAVYQSGGKRRHYRHTGRVDWQQGGCLWR